MADQGVVSGASFVATVIIGRWTHPNELGLYSLGMSLLICLFGAQEALIMLPYTIRQKRPQDSPAEQAGSALALTVILSALGAAIAILTGFGLLQSAAKATATGLAFALAVTIPFALLREFGRSYAFMHLRMIQPLILDCTASAAQIAMLCCLGFATQMHSASACAALGLACAASTGWWLYGNRRDFLIRKTRVLFVIKQDWRLGSWLFASQMASLLQGYIPLWILAFTQGASATGIYAACLSVASVAKPLLSGLGNVLMPKSVTALQENGIDGLYGRVVRDACLLFSAMAPVCVAALLGGNLAMIRLYHGPEYIGTGPVVSALALALLAAAAGMPASNALASIERPRPIFWTGFLAAISTVLATWFLVEWGPLGAAWGLTIGNAIGAGARWAAFGALAKRVATPTKAAADGSPSGDPQVLRQSVLSKPMELARGVTNAC